MFWFYVHEISSSHDMKVANVVIFSGSYPLSLVEAQVKFEKILCVLC